MATNNANGVRTNLENFAFIVLIHTVQPINCLLAEALISAEFLQNSMTLEGQNEQLSCLASPAKGKDRVAPVFLVRLCPNYVPEREFSRLTRNMCFRCA